ncbi:MAG: hypothetical protein EA424_13595 [Planctomycetaceae bacterium]|nr:MAG: hypothetical protein EA424_13595 [Planctomycetaceae bacterium]
MTTNSQQMARPRQLVWIVSSCLVIVVVVLGCEMNLSGPKTPVECFMRDSVWGKGKVVIVRNASDMTINAWLYAHGRTTRFAIAPHGQREIGWLEGYEFGQNSTVIVGAEGFAPETFSWTKE